MTKTNRLWTVYVDGAVLDHPNLYDAGYAVLDLEIDLAVNQHGGCSFTVPKWNPRYDDIKNLGAIVTVYNGNREVFRGRVSEIDRDFYDNLDVYCEGQLAFLCDSMVQPFAYKGTVTDLLSFIIDTHNKNVSDEKKFKLGTVSVTDPDNNGVLVRSSDSALSCWEIISSRLIDMLGGYFIVRKSGTAYYIDYLAEITKKSEQTVSFGENMLNLDEYIDAENIVTVLYPFGAKIDQDGTNENSYDKYMEEPEGSGVTLWHGNRVTVREANSGVMYVENEAGINMWGRVCGTNVWDDVTLPSNLLERAKKWLENSVKATTTITLSAVDLSTLYADVDAINVGELVTVISNPHKLELDMPCTKVHIEPGAPDKSTITLGSGSVSLTNSIASLKGED